LTLMRGARVFWSEQTDPAARRSPAHPSIFSAAMNAFCGISTLPNWRIFLPAFYLSSGLRLRVGDAADLAMRQRIRRRHQRSEKRRRRVGGWTQADRNIPGQRRFAHFNGSSGLTQAGLSLSIRPASDRPASALPGAVHDRRADTIRSASGGMCFTPLGLRFAPPADGLCGSPQESRRGRTLNNLTLRIRTDRVRASPPVAPASIGPVHAL